MCYICKLVIPFQGVIKEHFWLKMYFRINWLLSAGILESESEILHELTGMAKLFSQCVGRTNALAFLSMVQTLDKFTASLCVWAGLDWQHSALSLAGSLKARLLLWTLHTNLDRQHYHLTSMKNKKMKKCKNILHILHPRKSTKVQIVENIFCNKVIF